MCPRSLVQSPVTLADLQAVLPSSALYQSSTASENSLTGWLLSPEPYSLSARQHEILIRLGPALYQLSLATDQLYRQSQKSEALAWVSTYFDQGKPEGLLTFAQMKRFKAQVPLVIRPDLLVTADGFRLCEIDAVPGGLGFTSAMMQAYAKLGFNLLSAPQGDLPQAFLGMLTNLRPDLEAPVIAVVVSDEAGDYRPEMAWLVAQIQQRYPQILLAHPRELTLHDGRLGVFDDELSFKPVDILYRFFELFDLANIPQIELIQYAVKKGLVACTPPFKPHLEEKLLLALIHHPRLRAYWTEALSKETLSFLQSLIPESWILDPSPVPPGASITPPLTLAGEHFFSFEALAGLTQKQRELVIKPSGFSPDAWGSRGVSVGHDMSQASWQTALSSALSKFSTTPHLLQRFEPPYVEAYRYFDPVTGEVVEAEGRTRLCPYYLVNGDDVNLSGALATTCPKNKKVIHGMSEGVMRPVLAEPRSEISE